MDVCLLQSAPTAARVVETWRERIGKALRSNLFETALQDFNAKTVLAGLNEDFQREWQRCGGHGYVTEDGGEVYWKLDPNIGQTEAKDEEGALYTSETEACGYGVRGLWDFLSRLRLYCIQPSADSSCGGGLLDENHLHLLPNGFAGHYGELFVSLLRWKTMEDYATSTWRLGLSCGQVLEVSFFLNTARYILITLQRAMWDRLRVLSEGYRSNLRFEQGTLYTYTSVEDFTREHQAFMEECRFGAMLDKPFFPVWGIFMRLIRLIEAVRLMLKNVSGEMAVVRRRILAEYHLLDLSGGTDLDSARYASSEDSCSTCSSFSSSETRTEVQEKGHTGELASVGLSEKKLTTTTDTTTITYPLLINAKRTKTIPRGKKFYDGVSTSKISPSNTSTLQKHQTRCGVKKTKKKKVKVKHSSGGVSSTVKETTKRTPKVSPKGKSPVNNDESTQPGANKPSESFEHLQQLNRIARKKISEAHEPLHRRLRDGMKFHLRGLVTITEELIAGLCYVRDECTLKELGEIQNTIHEPYAAFEDFVQNGNYRGNEGKANSIADPIDNIKRKKWIEYRQRVLTERIAILTSMVNLLQTTLDLLNRKI
ncbi:unnamed protein product [Phytomonas sp. Hart1]|nr:unnamed protein product [Phytomonas sp. Hart1]|eukprot:CCW66943.1 unnamed protein product [Phytomonas sp. isolate Hart1]